MLPAPVNSPTIQGAASGADTRGRRVARDTGRLGATDARGREQHSWLREDEMIDQPKSLGWHSKRRSPRNPRDVTRWKSGGRAMISTITDFSRIAGMHTCTHLTP